MSTKKYRKTDWKKISKLTGLPVETLKKAMRTIPHSQWRRRSEILETLLMSEGTPRTSQDYSDGDISR